MSFHLDIFTQQLNKSGEELCGDTAQVTRSGDRTIVVLSDGLGSGVKANILSTLTARILVEMLSADAPLDETVKTVIGTLPVCKVRQLAYATFTAATVDASTGQFRIVNFDNPRVVWVHKKQVHAPPRQMRDVLGRQVAVLEGTLQEGDFLGVFSDGVLHAGLGKTMNLGWGWENVAQYTRESLLHFGGSARATVSRVMQKVAQLYGGRIGDDTSFIGLLARQKRSLILFTGPPMEMARDEAIVARFLSLHGRHVVCGGTTGNIVARYLDEEPEIVLSTMRPSIPPIGRLREVDLLTEGILTMSRALERLRRAIAGHPLPDENAGDVLLARELLQADHIHLMLGQRINEYYQNPTLPPNLSLRKNLVNEMVGMLRSAGKEVVVEEY